MPPERTTMPREIADLQAMIQHKRKVFDEGMRSDMAFEDLKDIFVAIRTLEKQLEACKAAVNTAP